MPLNNAGLSHQANALQEVLLFAQLHDGVAGVDGEDNIAVAGRQPVSWALPALNGEFGLASAIDFIGGTANGAVYSLTLWDEETDGTFYGEFPFTGGDATFNGAGAYQVTVIDFGILVDDL